MQVNPVGYQNNRDWASSNKSKGFIASYFSVGSTLSGVVKACSSKDSKVYKVSNFVEKLFYSVSNCLQYFLFGRKDDVLGDDEEKRPLAARIGKAATFQERYVNPIARPTTVILDDNTQLALNDALNWFDVTYWRIRFASLKINWKGFKELPKAIKKLFDSKLNAAQKDDITLQIANTIYPFLGLIGTLTVSVLTPLKIILKVFGKENKLINLLASLGQSCGQHIMYFFKFTLPLLWKGNITKDKTSHAVFAVGVASDLINVSAPIVELLSGGDQFTGIFSNVNKSLASNLSSLFFAYRRNYLGKDWLATNTKN